MPEEGGDLGRSVEDGLDDGCLGTRDLGEWVVHMRFVIRLQLWIVWIYSMTMWA